MTTYGTTPMNTTTPGRAWTSLVLGVLIFLVPFATGANTSEYATFAYSNYVVGAAVFILAAISVWAARNNLTALAWLEGANTLLGLWTIASPFVLATEQNALYANVALGIILGIVGGWDSYVGMTNAGARRTTRRGRTT